MHTRPRIARIAAAATFLAAGAALAQISLEPPPGGGGSVSPPAPATRPATAPTTAPAPAATGESAQSVLQGLLREKPANGSTNGDTPASPLPTATGPALGPDGLLREGERIELRAGRLTRQENGTTGFVFDPKDKPAYPPMIVIPSRRMAIMEDFAKGADVNFPAISAEVTQYRGKNYLYIQPTGVPLPAAAPGPAPAAAPPPASAPGPDQVAPGAPTVSRLPEGSLIINRTGRLVRDTKTGLEMFVLDADGKQMADPPMGVIPCRMLEVMENQTDNGNKAAKYRISGEVTLYRGRNYLYLKKLTAIIDLHQGITPGLGGQ